MVGSWLLDENFNGIPDGIYDNVIKHIDFPLEDVDGNVLGDDWDASFQLLELPSSDVLAGLTSDFGSKLCDDDSGPLGTPSEVFSAQHTLLYNNFCQCFEESAICFPCKCY